MLRIERVESPAALAEVRELILEYAAATHVDLSFQRLDDEVADLGGFYAALFLARWDGQAAGCVALRRIDHATAEMKRLYVRDGHRGRTIGRALAERVIEEARRQGFARIRLDTLPTMGAALALYRSLGFVEIEPYRYNPIEGSRYLELAL